MMVCALLYNNILCLCDCVDHEFIIQREEEEGRTTKRDDLTGKDPSGSQPVDCDMWNSVAKTKNKKTIHLYIYIYI